MRTRMSLITETGSETEVLPTFAVSRRPAGHNRRQRPAPPVSPWCVGMIGTLLLFKSLRDELQRAAVLGHGAYDVLRCPVGDLSLDLDTHAHPGRGQRAQVLP